MITVLLVDDHDIVRTGVSHILSDAADIDIVGEACSGEQALKLARELKPDVILMDLNMPGLGGLEATRRLHRSLPSLGIIILTVQSAAPFPTQLLEAGARGYLTKGCDAEELLAAIRKVHAGQKYIGKDIAQRLALALMPGADRSPLEELTTRELEVMMMLVQGSEVNEVAERLALSPKTVATYKYRVYDKLGVRNEVGLTHLAIRFGMIEGGGAAEL